MNNMLKKFISILLAVVMSFQVAPLSVFAAERSSNIAEDSQSNVSLKQSLAEIIEETKTIIPEDLKKELSKNYSYMDLSKKHKNELSDFLNVSSETLGKLSNQISNSNDITAVVLNSLDAGISINTLLELSKNYSVDECLNLERKFKYLSDNIISKQYIDNFAKLITNENIKLDDLYGAVILSNITGKDYSWAYEKADIHKVDLNRNSISNDEDFIYLQLQYNLSSEAIENVVKEENKSPAQICSEIKAFEETANLYSLNSDLSTRDVSTQQIPQAFSKYQIPDASNYRDNLSIDQTYGMITYNKELITLKGKNGLDLQFGIRFDQNDAVIPGNYKGIEHSASVYQVMYKTDWYIVDDKGEHLEKSDFSKLGDFYYNASEHNKHLSKDTIVEKITDSYYHVFVVKDATIMSKDVAAFQESTYETTHNNSIYNLGEGWAFTVPSIELFTLDYKYGQTNVIHFADGQKYSFSYNNGKYNLVGYDFNDIQLFDAKENEFSCDGKKAKWVLTYKNGRCEYFSSDGLYLGSTDQRGEKATATIRAYYDKSGYLVKITDSVGRSIKINHCVDEYDDGWGGIYEEYYTDIVLCDSDNKTEKTIYHLNKFIGGSGNGIPVLSILNVVEDEKTIKSTRFYYGVFNTSVFYNVAGGTIFFPHSSEEAFPYKRLDDCMVNILTGVFDYSNSGQESARLQIDYEGGARYISNATVVIYNRVKSVKNTEQKYDDEGNLVETPKNLEKYNYYLENKKTKKREYLSFNGNWNSSFQQMWPQELTNDYVLEISENFKDDKAQKSTEYHYGDNKYNDLVSIYDLSGNTKRLYSVSDIQRSNNNHNIIEALRLVNDDGGDYYCTLKKQDFDDYANIIYEWVAGGSSNGMEQVQAYYTISNQETKYNGVNKSIPSYVSSQTSSEDEDMHYVAIRTENVLDSTNSYIVKQNNYIHDTRYDWDKFEDVETKTLVDTTEYVHDSQGRLIETNQSVVNKDNTDHKITEYTYDSKYGVYTETVTDIGAYYGPEGNAVNSQKKYTYDILGRILSCEDNTKEHTTTYQYDALGTVIKSVNPDGTEILTVPDYTNKNVVETLADGSKAKYVYDLWDNLVEEYIWIPSESKFVLSAKYEYDNNNRNIAKYDYTSADSSKYLCTTYEYDFLGRTVRETIKDETGKIFGDKSVDTKIVTYDNSPCEKETTIYYDDNGVVSSHVSEYNDIGGNTVRIEQEYQTGKYYVDNFVYGNYNRLLSSSGDTVETAEYVYDDFGRVVEKKNADGNTVFYTYDTQDQLVEQRDQNGAIVKEYYTPHGIKYKSSTLVDTIDNVDYYSNTILGYDVYGNVVQSKQSINRPKDEEKYSISKYSYDINNRLILTEDVIDDTHSRYSQYCYDNGGRLLKSFTGLTSPITIDSPNDYTANSDKDFSVVSYEYDDFGNQIKYTDALGQSEKYEYTFSNLLSKKTLRNGMVYKYSYDSMGRCVKETVGNESVDYTYNGLGQLISVKDKLGTTSYDYDLINRVISESRDDIEDKRDYKSDYQYSNKGITDYKLHIKNNETKDFEPVIHETYEYNNLKQLSKLTHSDITSPNEILTSTYNYGIAGELLNKKVTGTSIEQNVTYKYNKAGQNTEILNIGKLASGVVADYPDETTFSEKYAYDLGGNLTEKISNNKTVKNSSVLNQKQSQTSYTYDSLNRLTKEQITETLNNGKTDSWQDTYTFDENDNRLSKVHENGKGTTVTAYKYDSANKLVSEQSDDYKYLYDYDTNGNLVSKLSVNSEGDSQELEKYTYDSFNRLSSVKKGKQTFDYLYDGNGKRIQKNSVVSQLQEFWYNGKIVFEGLSKSNESEQNQSYYSYTFDNDLLAVSDSKGSTNLAVVNSHGDTVDLLSVETPYFTEYKYDSFGNQVSNYLPAVNNPYQYNGKYFDFETGFYYLNARYYNPAVGRFMQEDTYHGQIKNASTLNLYNYCGSNPIAYEDGTGHFWETAFDIAGLAWSVYDFAKKPNLWNGLCVAWDVVALVAPCIPGSYVAKGAKLLYKGAKYVVKTSKSSKRANKLIKTLDKAHDIYKAYKKSKNSYKCYETSAEFYRKKKQIAKANTEKNVKSLVNSAKNLAASKGRKFTQESAEQISKKTFVNIKDIDSSREYTKSSLKMGQDMHKIYKADIANQTTKIKEFVLPSKKRIDFIDFDSGTISELKPYNPRAIKSGYRQLEMYLKEVQNEFPNIDWQTQLDVY